MLIYFYCVLFCFRSLQVQSWWLGIISSIQSASVAHHAHYLLGMENHMPWLRGQSCFGKCYICLHATYYEDFQQICLYNCTYICTFHWEKQKLVIWTDSHFYILILQWPVLQETDAAIKQINAFYEKASQYPINRSVKLCTL